MATLEKIRNKSALLVGSIGLGLLAFIIGDFLNSGQSFFQMNNNKIAVVDGTRIEIETFQDRVTTRTEEVQEMFRQQYGMSMPAGYTSRINQEVFDQMVTEILINNETEALGLGVTSTELYDLIQGENIVPMIRQNFTNPETGEFNKAALQQFIQNVVSTEAGMYGGQAAQQLAQQKAMWLNMEQTIKDQRLTEKFVNLLTKSVVANNLDLEDNFAAEQTSVDFAYAMQPFTSIKDEDVTITDADLKALYEKDKEYFKVDGSRNVKYLIVDIVPSEGDYKTTEEKINNLKESFSTTTDIAGLLSFNTDVPYVDAYTAVRSMNEEMKNFVETSDVNEVFGPFFENEAYKMYRIMGKTTAPDSLEVRHIMLPLQDLAASTERADSIMKVLKAGGDFGKLAQEFSVDQQSAANNGSIGWITEAVREQLGQEFLNSCFAAKGNDYFITESLYGIHVAQVTNRTANIPKAKVAQMVFNVSASSTTYADLYNNISQYISENNTVEKFQESAKDAGFVVASAALTTNDYSIGNITDARQAVRWAYNTDKGNLSEIYNLEDKFLVVGLSSITKEGYTPMKEVESQLKNRLYKDKKAEKIINDLKAKNLTSVAAYAEAMSAVVDTARFVSFNTEPISGIGTEPVLTGLAPLSPKGAVEGPIRGNNGVYVFAVTNKTVADGTMDIEAEKSTFNNTVYSNISRQLMQVLRDRAEIEDTRIKYF